MSDACGMWVYAAVPPHSPVPELTGVAGEPLSVVRASSLGAVVGWVPFTVAEGDRDRVEGIARAHHRVVTELHRHTAVVPFRLGTVVADEAGVGAMLEAYASQLLDGIRLATGRTEWGVKVFLRDVPAQAAGQPAASGGSGKAYLMRRRAERQASEVHRHRVAQHADRVHEALSRYAAVSRRYPAHGPQIAVLNAAYLVPADDSSRFVAAVAEVENANPALRTELTGPWPPYCVAVRLDDRAGAGRR
ncbi:GvpL/GvpF family gas vesicle protein [Actinoplanes sp. NPDC049548]|uniref:GvpL/GvpF family gas vesicle protein n=1 Tax=Actinoplanes sp. NPDC049548 TaxID=3155152 RepID=UPI003444B70F